MERISALFSKKRTNLPASVEQDEKAVKCQNCGLDFAKSWSAYCANCDRTFDTDGASSRAGCSGCGKAANYVFKDVPMEICKRCLSAALPELDEPAAKAELQATALPCPRVKSVPSLTANQQESLSSNASGAEHDPSMSFLDELWRFIGCVCGNQVPDCFDLLESKWSRKSYYCLDCQQPYSSFLWSTELRSDQCPRCNGARVETDRIAAGDAVILCHNCKSIVPKSRFDAVSREVQRQCEVEKRDQPTAASPRVSCPHCGATEVQLTVTQSDENPCVMLICSRCGSADFLAGWDRAGDRIVPNSEIAGKDGAKNSDLERPPKTPAGFEELTRCCGDLASLHPVEDDPDDDMLVCEHCQQLISLRGCKDTRIPMTVSALRHALNGTFSSGEMGRPYRTVKVTRLDELKPADQLDFKKSMYSHHAIVDAPLPESGEVQLIEYTGESNMPTILAFMQILPTKACIKKSPLKFEKMLKYVHRVDYHSLDCYHPQAVLRRAANRIGEVKYNLIGSNCEHFSNWAKANITFSRQVEKIKESARSTLRCAVMEMSDLIDNLPADGAIRAAVDLLQDMRAEMLRVLFKPNSSSSIRDFWCPIRMVLKWAIRGIPLLFACALWKDTGGKLLLPLDALMKPVCEVVSAIPEKLLSIKDQDDKVDKGEKE